jgi:DNA ligase (NAD+)
LWHKFDLVKQQPFIQWLKALSIPLNQKAFPALSAKRWSQVLGMSEQEWQILPGMGKAKTSQLLRWLADPQIRELGVWLAAQGVMGFQDQ